MPKVYHLLPEAEPFSEFHGGAISRWVANVLRGDSTGKVVACSADDSWKFSSAAINVVRDLEWYHTSLRATSYRLPWAIRRPIIRRLFRKLTMELQEGDIVWVHNRPEFAAALARDVHRPGASLVLHMHNAHLESAKLEMLRELDVDRLVFVSEYLRISSMAALRRQVASDVLYNGADGEVFKPRADQSTASQHPMKVLFASRLVKEKGPHILLEALRTLHQLRIPVTGLFVGGAHFGKSTPDRFVEELRRDAPPNVSFHPYCAGEDLAKLFQEADVFCLPSVWHDPFPLAPLEAMAAGLPIVATNSGGIPEALAFGGGILIQRNSVSALTDVLHRLAMSPAARRTLSAQALSSFRQHFQWSKVQMNYRNILEQVANA